MTCLCMLSILTINSCQKYLDIVPDNLPTLDNAFTMRTQAEKFLFTCYSYMPKDADPNLNPAFNGADEVWRLLPQYLANEPFKIALGLQNVVTPIGDAYFTHLYRGIRDCNIFLDNIEKVRDLPESERKTWIAEVKFLKAYYHFYLMRMYGPIYLVKKNVSVEADLDEVKVSRSPVDECFDYVVQLLDEAVVDLPPTMKDQSMLGRITIPVSLSLKAKVLVTAASPLFNGNMDQSAMKNDDGRVLFNPTFAPEKWTRAAEACKDAINICEANGIRLFEFQPPFELANIPTDIKTQLSVRNSITERWNSEIIWANTQSMADNIQRRANPGKLDPAYSDNIASAGDLAPPIKIAEMFYSKNGIPLIEDNSWNTANGGYEGRFNLRKAEQADQWKIKKFYETAALHFDREPRFYANLGFDGGIWYGAGQYTDPDKLFHLMLKFKQFHGRSGEDNGSATGYVPKKLVHYQNVSGPTTTYNVIIYPWPLIRLADLYLLYAEALNEAEGPVEDVHTYVDLVRARAGLKSVKESWGGPYSKNTTKFESKIGMREIIHQERLIELSFEAQRFWDLRRWKEAVKYMNTSIKGWDWDQETAAGYYRPVILYNQTFSSKDYFWPISEYNLVRNPKFVQSLGW